jgi:hypothetical protein
MEGFGSNITRIDSALADANAAPGAKIGTPPVLLSIDVVVACDLQVLSDQPQGCGLSTRPLPRNGATAIFFPATWTQLLANNKVPVCRPPLTLRTYGCGAADPRSGSPSLI